MSETGLYHSLWCPMRSSRVGAEKRQHIVETAYALFRRNGFHATGIDRIIADAGVAKMTMYRHFPNKDGLIVEVLDWRAERFQRQIDRLASATGSPARKIETILDWHEVWFDSPDFHGCIFQHALAEFGDAGHPVCDAVDRQKRALLTRLTEILGPSMQPERAAGIAAAVFMLIEGATVMAQLGQGTTAIGQARKVVAAILASKALQ